MKSKEQVTKYVEEVFEKYDLSDYDFFRTTQVVDEERHEYEEIEIPLFPFDEIDDETLTRISVHTGLTKEEILNTDECAANKYWDMYPFLKLYEGYKTAWYWHSKYMMSNLTPEDILIHTIFFRKPYEKEPYNLASVNQRMIDKLKEIDKVIPGTYHKDAEIKNLEIGTETFFSYPECGDMIRAFIDMVDRLKELFFMALRDELQENEINELNFLASRLRATDATMPSVLITYDNICTYRKIYIEENLTDFFSYVRIRALVKDKPWRCKEFFEDMNLVQKFTDIFPEAKSEMRRFAMEVENFICSFAWSDAKEIMDLPDCATEEEEEEFYRQVNDNYPVIYVEKTKEEMFRLGKYVKILKKAALPEKKGGLSLPKREIDLTDTAQEIVRVQNRVNEKFGGNK